MFFPDPDPSESANDFCTATFSRGFGVALDRELGKTKVSLDVRPPNDDEDCGGDVELDGGELNEEDCGGDA